jgi:hypothetical protein
MSDDTWIRVTVLIHANGLVEVACEGDTVYCKVISHAIGATINMVANIIVMLVNELESMLQKKAGETSKVSDGTM